jgi:NADH-quinone oxidoreductase subunit L
MGAIQDLDRMSGFRRAMPFTYGCMVIGGLALSGVPPFAGFWSKDEIISLEFDRGGWHAALGVLGYLGSFLTAIYTFRMIFRAFWGEPNDEARELEHGHLHHVDEPVNPVSGEVEDTEVGFPGPEHVIAERAGAMKVAMGCLAVLAVVGGLLQVPGVTSAVHSFLEPTFRDSRLYAELEPSDVASWIGLVIGAAIAVAGIAVAYTLYVRDTRRPPALRERFAALHGFFVHKWYFDELIDAMVVRPGAWAGRFARGVIERGVIDRGIVGGSSDAVRALSAAVRGVQSGYLRYYAALLLVGLTGLGFYFLVSA